MCFPSSRGAQAEARPQCPGLPHPWQGHSDGAELLLTESSHMGGGMVSGCCWWEGHTWEGEWARENPNVLWDMRGRGGSVRAAQDGGTAQLRAFPWAGRQLKTHAAILASCPVQLQGGEPEHGRGNQVVFPGTDSQEVVAGGDGPGMVPPAREGRVPRSFWWDWTRGSRRKWLS